jgi:hypothetical protein
MPDISEMSEWQNKEIHIIIIVVMPLPRATIDHVRVTTYKQ